MGYYYKIVCGTQHYENKCKLISTISGLISISHSDKIRFHDVLVCELFLLIETVFSQLICIYHVYCLGNISQNESFFFTGWQA